MNDKRSFYFLINAAKEEFPNDTSVLESIKAEFDTLFESISPRQRMALREFPLQYVKRILETDGGWTTQLHIWAEEGVEDILNLDPVYLSLKNYHGDTVLMMLVSGATGSLTNITNYELIEKILKKDYSYMEESKGGDGNVLAEEKNVLDELDVFGQTVLDYLVDVAFSEGEYESEEPDLMLQNILTNYINSVYSKDNENTNDEIPVSKTFVSTEEKEEVTAQNSLPSDGEIPEPPAKSEEKLAEENTQKLNAMEDVDKLTENPSLSQSLEISVPPDHTSPHKDKEARPNL